MRVRDIMTRDLFTVCEGNKLLQAKELMVWGKVRHIPVIDNDYKLIGIISHRDLLQASVSSVAHITKKVNDQLLSGIPIDKVMRTHVITISDNDSVQLAAHRMRTHKIGCLPVVQKDGVLIGIITEADFLFLIEQIEDLSQFKIKPLLSDTPSKKKK